MSTYLLVKFLHLVGFAYWLGGDLGVFHSSFYVADKNRSAEVRVAAAKILFWLDQVPRICMTMMLPLGLQLGATLGLLPLGPALMVMVWLASVGWLGMVIYLHVAKSSALKMTVTRFDYAFRLLLSLGLIGVGIAALAGIGITMPYWLALKLAIFGGLVGLGLVVRTKLKAFGPAFAKVAAGDPSDADNDAIQRSLGGTRPLVVGIWIGLFASAALGLHLV